MRYLLIIAVAVALASCGQATEPSTGASFDPAVKSKLSASLNVKPTCQPGYRPYICWSPGRGGFYCGCGRA